MLPGALPFALILYPYGLQRLQGMEHPVAAALGCLSAKPAAVPAAAGAVPGCCLYRAAAGPAYVDTLPPPAAAAAAAVLSAASPAAAAAAADVVEPSRYAHIQHSSQPPDLHISKEAARGTFGDGHVQIQVRQEPTTAKILQQEDHA